MPETLLLLPGLGCDVRLFAAQTAALRDVAAPVVPEWGEAATIAEMADAALAAAPAGPFALAGLSMGGYVAFEIVRRAPERVGRLALLDTTPHADTDMQRRLRRSLVEKARGGRFDAIVATIARMPGFLAAGPGRDEVAATVTAMARDAGAAAYARQQEAIAGRPDSRPLLPEIARPALVLCGAEDGVTPPAVHEEMHAALPDARLVVVPGAGHLPPLEQPAAVTAALRAWLTA